MKHNVYLQLLLIYSRKYEVNFDEKEVIQFFYLKMTRETVFIKKTDKKNVISIYVLFVKFSMQKACYLC